MGNAGFASSAVGVRSIRVYPTFKGHVALQVEKSSRGCCLVSVSDGLNTDDSGSCIRFRV